MHVGLGAVGEAAVELVEDAELAPHVVGRLGLVAERRTAQDELALGVLHQVRQIGRAAGELTDLRRAGKTGNVRLQIRVDDSGIEFFAGADLGGLIGERHAFPL
ncbi:hypothetical protein D3C77_545770 [compost metagenome]